MSHRFIPLNLPKAALKITKKESKFHVYCISRKKNLVLTPEEWVRQHAIHFLIKELNTPLSHIGTETGIKVNKMEKRCDIIVFGKDQLPLILIECKATSIPLNHATLQQIAQYNKKINAPYLWITNGISHHYLKIDTTSNSLTLIEKLPLYPNN
jgi:hypothetical protein